MALFERLLPLVISALGSADPLISLRARPCCHPWAPFGTSSVALLTKSQPNNVS